jgi:prevent-host-death family protein
MSKTISAREANQRFSQILGQAAAGEEIVITRRGVPVARLIAAGPGDETSDRGAAIERLMGLLDVSLGGGRFDRDSLYDR